MALPFEGGCVEGGGEVGEEAGEERVDFLQREDGKARLLGFLLGSGEPLVPLEEDQEKHRGEQ